MAKLRAQDDLLSIYVTMMEMKVRNAALSSCIFMLRGYDLLLSSYPFTRLGAAEKAGDE